MSLSAPGSSSALIGRRILELADEKTAYCGKLLADMGADLILIEPPGGHATRRSLDSGKDAAAFLYNNTSKRGVVLDLEREEDRQRFLLLLDSADALIEGETPGRMDRLGLGWPALRRRKPDLVFTSITGFGQSGPKRLWKSSDLVATALGGAAIVTGYAEDPPLRLAGSQAHRMASVNAAVATMIALRHAGRTGKGQQVDISVQEAVASVSHITGVGKWLDDGIIPRRCGTGLVASVPSGAYPCTDGLVYLMVNRPLHWQELARWVFEETGQEAMLNPLWEGPSAHRIEDRSLIDTFISELTSRHTVAEMFHQGQKRHLAITPMQSATRVVQDPQLEARGYFGEVRDRQGGSRRYPGPPYRHQRTPAKIRATAPRVGEHEQEIWGRPGSEPSDPIAAPSSSSFADIAGSSGGSGPLAGLRVLEFSMGMAGPWIGRMMAFCGAEVIKVESKKHPDVTRQYVPPWAPELGAQSRLSPWFTDWNAGKRFVGLDLARPEAVGLARDLAARSDVVIENFAPGVLDKLGLGWEELRTRKADLIYLGTSGFGDDGPYRPYVTWGPNIEAVSGLAVSSGFAHRPCAMTHFAYPDAVAALHGLFAILCALEHRDRSGQGQYVYLSQCEAVIASFGDVMMECLETGRDPERIGNRATDAAPHGCYPCLGEDRWCAIAVAEDVGWQGLCSVAENQPWASDHRFGTLEARLQHVEELDAEIAAWTSGFDAYELEAALQRVGVAAGVVQTTEDQFRRDEQLRARGFFEEIQHELKGPVFANGIPLGLTGTPGCSQHAGAALGKDNAYVFGEILARSSADLARLEARGAIEESDEIAPDLSALRARPGSLKN